MVISLLDQRQPQRPSGGGGAVAGETLDEGDVIWVPIT